MENLDPMPLLTQLLQKYERMFIENRDEIDRLQFEREVLQQQISHLESLMLGHQALNQEQEMLLRLVAPLKTESTGSPPPEVRRFRPTNRANTGINSSLLKEKYQGMGVLNALLEVLESSPGKQFTIGELSQEIFVGDRSQKTRSNLRNLIAKELSRGVKEGKVERVPKMKGCYVCKKKQSCA